MEARDDERQCRFEFAPGVRCQMAAGHDEPYYPYLDYGQSGWYSDILSRGSGHVVHADPAPLPPREEWTGAERKDTVESWPVLGLEFESGCTCGPQPHVWTCPRQSEPEWEYMSRGRGGEYIDYRPPVGSTGDWTRVPVGEGEQG